MNKLKLIIVITGFIFGCNTEGWSQQNLNKENLDEEWQAVSQIDSYDYQGLVRFLTKKDDKTYVINFWATWCKPCVEELPEFEKLNKLYQDQNVEVLLVNLDFPNQIDKKVIPFINKYQLKSKVILMNDPDQNTWISNISKKWQGSIPATLIYNINKRKFYEQSFDYNTLEKELNKFLK